MANKKGGPGNQYARVIANRESVGKGKKQTVEEIVKEGSKTPKTWVGKIEQEQKGKNRFSQKFERHREDMKKPEQLNLDFGKKKEDHKKDIEKDKDE